MAELYMAVEGGEQLSLLRTTERKSSMNFLSFTDILRAHLGISINLQIYPKFSKFTMTNVTVPLN